MKACKTLLALLFLLSAVLCGGEYFYQDDPEITALEHISRRMKKVLPFSSFPVHGGDILDYADSLLSDPASASLNETERAMLEDIAGALEEQRDHEILLKGGLALAYEQRLSAGPFTIDGEETPNAEDFRRAFQNFSPVLRLDAGIGAFDGPWVAGRIDLAPSWDNDFSPFSNFFTEVNITYDILKRGIFAWNGRYLNFFLGRDTVHWGNPAGSTLYPSALLPYLDSLRLNVPLGPFSFDYMLASIMPKKARHDVDGAVKRDYPNKPATGPNSGPLGDHFGFVNNQPDENPSAILVAGHRFQWNFGRVKAGIGGTVVYARSNNEFLITDVLPVTIYHNADSVPNNLTMILDAQWTICSGLSLSGMLGFDDISARTFGIADGEVPTIPAGVLQLEYSRAGGDLSQYYMLEGGYTHYLWGNFAYTDNPETWYGVYLARSIYRYAPNKEAVLLPLTSPYGPGALWGKLKTVFTFPHRNISAGAELLFLAKNSGANLVDTPYRVDEGLKGYDRWFLALDIPLAYTWKSLAFSVSPALLWGSGGHALECTLGLKWTLEGSAYFSVPRFGSR
ncbi:MAG: hypothetical protein LBC31_04740 [Treponema sp.]|jgi:hypothetical protein|nr:hypothetical protein [Treponema sp.]